jgi:hypothetical protein
LIPETKVCCQVSDKDFAALLPDQSEKQVPRMSSTSSPAKSSIPSREKSSQGAASHVRKPLPPGTTFADFISATRVIPSRRGDLLKMFQMMIANDAFPAVAEWSELYRLMGRLSAGDDAVDQARKLWREYRKASQ